MLHQASILNNTDLIAQHLNILEQVGSDKNSDAAVMIDFPDELLDISLPAWIKPQRRLVEKDDPGTVHQGLRDSKTLLHTAGKLAYGHILFIKKPHFMEQLLEISIRLISAKQKIEILQVFPGGHPAVISVRFRHNSNESLYFQCMVTDIHTVNQDLSGGRCEQPVQHSYGGSLARPVRPQKSKNIALLYMEI